MDSPHHFPIGAAVHQVWTLREQLLKLSAHVVGSVRRVLLHLPPRKSIHD